MLTKIKCAEQGKRVAIQRCLTAGLLLLLAGCNYYILMVAFP